MPWVWSGAPRARGGSGCSTRLNAPPVRRGRRRDRLDAAARAAVDFHLWRALAPLGDAEAAELAAGLVELAAGTEA